MKLPLIALLTVCAAASHALTQVQTATASYTVDRQGTFPSPAFDNPILQFSPSDGVLTAVDISWSVSSQVSIQATYVGGNNTERVGVTTTDRLDLGGTSVTRTIVSSRVINTSGNPVTIVGFIASGTATGSATDLAPFVGSGLVSPMTWTPNVQPTGFNNFFIVDIQGTASATATVTYTYAAPVPEPATLAALGLGTLALIRRRRQARA